MRVLLMFDDRDFRVERDEQVDEPELTQDLDLEVLWVAASRRDEAIFDSLRSAMLASLSSCEQVRYRQEVLADCLRHPDVVLSLYQLAVDVIAEEHTIYRATFFSQSSTALLSRSVTAMEMFVAALRRLRGIIEQNGDEFGSAGFSRLSETVLAELGDEYFDEIGQHLRTLRFNDGVLASARLGAHNQGIDYTLRTPNPENRSNRLSRRPPLHKPVFSRTIPREDDAGHDELAALRDRVLGLAADALAESAQHILGFFTALRTELAFYVGCLDLREHLVQRGLSICRPDVRPRGEEALSAQSLCDPCLAVRTNTPIHGNDLHADHKRLIIVTGANQGGKSTFLRSVGVAQLMMRAGMFVAAESFSAAIAVGVFTHYKRAEDATMDHGKFDEELQRMSRIVKRIRPGSVLLCNESFAATNEREGAEIAQDVLRAMIELGITVVFVTHNYELARRSYERHPETTLFLRAERGNAAHRPFRLVEGVPLPTSFGADLYHRTFGSDPTADRSGTSTTPVSSA